MIIKTKKRKETIEKLERMGFEYKSMSYWYDDQDGFYLEVPDTFKYALENEEIVG